MSPVGDQAADIAGSQPGSFSARNPAFCVQTAYHGNMEKDMTLRIETVRSLPDEARLIRDQVFIQEQGFTKEFDADDERAAHLIAFVDDQAAGTCRLLMENDGCHLQRLAVLPKFRSCGVASALVSESERQALACGAGQVILHAQLQAEPFYRKNGYVRITEPDLEDEGVPHIWMRHTLKQGTDRITEQSNPASARFSSMSALEAVRLMNREDARVLEVIQEKAPEIARMAEDITSSLRQGGRLIYAGAGTSGRLGVLDAAECPPTFGVDYDRVIGLVAGGVSAFGIPDETAEDSEEAGAAALETLHSGPRDFVLGIAASGRTPFVMGALRSARKHGSSVAAIVCTPDSPFAVVAPVLSLVCGPEIITGSTRLKAGTACKLVLNMLSTIVFTRLGCVYGNEMVDMRPDNEKLKVRAIDMLMRITGCSRTESEELLVPGRSVKTAAVMHRLRVDEETARQLLETAGGRLEDVEGGGF